MGEVRDIERASFVVIDVETTGLYPWQGDRVCEIGALKLRGFKVINSYHSLINPGREIPEGVLAIHGISPRLLESAPKFKEVGAYLWGFIQDSILVAQNAKFDLGFINTELSLCGYPTYTRPAIDTIRLAKFVVPGLPSYSLNSLAGSFGIRRDQLHRAMADVQTTAKIFTLCTQRLIAIRQVRGLSDLIKLGAP
jgi:DNA polymerase III epsilon subunit